MELRKEKIMSIYPDQRNEFPQLQTHSSIYDAASAPLLRSNGRRQGRKSGTEGFRSKVTEVLKLGWPKIFSDNYEESWKKKKILDPGSDTVLHWNLIFVFSSLLALIVDPIFLYLPVIVGQGNSSCMKMDMNLGTILTYFRTITDFFYLFHVLIKFRIAYVAPTSQGFGRGELVMDPRMIARRYLRTDFFMDLTAALPLPQVLIWLIIPARNDSHINQTSIDLVLMVLLQYIPRLYQIFPMGSEIIKAARVISKTAWVGAVYNMLLYLIASHVFGAAWYLLALERYAVCWESSCINEVGCSTSYLDCKSLQNANRILWEKNTTVFDSCDVQSQNLSFNFGMFNFLLSNSIPSIDLLSKSFFCFWWGLQNLSCYAQVVITSTYLGENIFSISVALAGLILFAHLIGNTQTYLASITGRVDEWRLKRRDIEEWMSHRQLPQDLRARVESYIQYQWLATKGADEEAILHSLPTDIRRDIKRHLCLDLVRRVSFFSQMDEQLLDAICECLVSYLSTKETYIVREGDKVTEMLFIIRGTLESSTTDGGRRGFFNSIILRPGDFCGEELLEWALLDKSTLNLPSSTRTVKALKKVEAFALKAEDLKFVVNQFRRYFKSKKLQHTFRFYSHHWRTWAACFIQTAWHQYKRRNTTKIQNLGVAIIVSMFAGNSSRMATQKINGVEVPLQKPEEPEYLTEPDDE